jgi:CHAT domain-containing protein
MSGLERVGEGASMYSGGPRAARPKSIVLAGFLSLLATQEVLLAQLAGADRAPSRPHLELSLSNIAQAAPRRSGDPASYVFRAQEGKTYLVAVEQNGLDFIVTVTDPAGAKRSYNTPLKRDERELVLIENAHAGAYSVSVVSEELTDAHGRHTIRVHEIPSDSDARYTNALAKMTEGAAANRDGTRAKAQEALGAYADAAELWRVLGDRRHRAQALYSVAMLEYWVEYDWTKAAATAKAASELYEGVVQPTLRSNAMLLQAMALIESLTKKGGDSATSEADAVLSLLRTSYDLVEPVGGPYDLARREYFTGLAFNNVGELGQAQQAWERAAILFDSADEWLEKLNVQFNLAVAAIQEGRNARAIEALEAILQEPRHDSDLHFRASVLDNLAAAHRRLGNIDEALRTYSAALEAHRRVEDSHGEASSLHGIASTYFASGDLTLASEYALQARTVADGAEEGTISSASRMTLGNVAFLKAEYESALDFHRTALDITSSKLVQSQLHVLVAKDLVAMGRNGESRVHGAAALELAETAASPLSIADARQQLGMISLAVGDIVDASSSFEAALQLYASLGLRGAQADAYHGLALAARAEGVLDDAIRYGEQSLDQIEALREKVSAPELRALYGAGRRTYYETQVDLLMSRGESAAPDESEQFLADALTASERARARLTIDLLSEASVDLYKGVDQGLAQRKRELSEQLAELRSQQDTLLSSLPVRRDQLEALVQEMATIENALNLLETELRRNNPRYASLANVATLSATEIQALLDSESVLLQYSLAESRSFVWVVTSDAIRAVELADRNTIEVAARRLYESLRIMWPSGSRDDLLIELARHVLDPVAPFLTEKRVLVVADGALQYIPFSVLPVQAGEAREPLLARHEVVNLPSFSVLAIQRARPHTFAGRKTLAVFADPVFERADQRFARSEIAPARSAAEREPPAAAQLPCLVCLFRGPDGRNLARLPATGAEARAIAELVPTENRLIQTGFAASRANVLGGALDQYRVLHFATHGLVDSEYPALSALALSRFDESGQPQDGFLRLGDIYNLNLNADLVVLSACDTALGEAIRGEGLIGLTQGFIYAGARSLVASLWQVPDGATAALMIRFYEYMLRDGQRPADALRNAQLSIAAEQRWADPFFWGAFTISGDWM